MTSTKRSLISVLLINLGIQQRLTRAMRVTKTSSHPSKRGYQVIAEIRKQLQQRKRIFRRRLSAEHGTRQSPIIRPTASPWARVRHDNAEKAFVVGKGHENQKFRLESLTEFHGRPHKCTRVDRTIVVRTEIDVTKGKRFLFFIEKYFFYITNDTADDV